MNYLDRLKSFQWVSKAIAFLLLQSLILAQSPTNAPTLAWKVGAAKTDITPDEPVRLSGYGNRSKSTSEIDDRLHVRAMVLKHAEQTPLVIVSLDAIGLSATLTDRISSQLEQKFSLTRSNVVLCTTHSHTAPHLEDALTNLFSTPMEPEEREHMLHYSQQLVESVVQTVGDALARLQPATVEFGTGRANFAINRRLLKNNAWAGFGTVDDGPVDRTVRVIHAKRPDGKSIAVAYQYACHCTSISPELNHLSGDWAGLSSGMIEDAFKQAGSQDAVALPIIGCGADANPNPRGTYEHSVAHAKEMAESVRQVCSNPMSELPAPKSQAFQLIAIASERPTREKLDEMSKSASFVERNFSATMLEILKHKDRLPETYPAPVHLWNFGDQLAWVFMGGEVVVDYQIRLEKELSQFPHVWVAGYVDDVFAYVASERLRGEGGYEVDGSMLYYNQPGRWVTGTEDLLVSRILEMAKQQRPLDQPLSADDSLRSIEMAKGWTVELVASEPLVEDPVNIAFDADGSVWVVEMGDYPSGGRKSGRIKRLVDTNGDGKLDTSTVFLDQLSYPAGVYPWRGGVVVACAPDVFFAKDTDNDGVADERRVLLTGFPLANPQHRVNGFTYGLDNRLHMGIGAEVKEIEEVTTGRKVKISGCDISLDVDSGIIELESGSTQYIRGCDSWGNWFGNDNSHPLYHYALDREWLTHARVPIRSLTQHAMQPPTAPPVFPVSRDADRFNDLFAANRFTSACSSIICKSPGATDEMKECALVCESVHNLVSRMKLERDGASFKGSRFQDDVQNEWMRSSDPWFRPVRIENAPDGTLWVTDMYRRVIEHPQWIPDDWQRRIDVRAGDDKGRIYRAYRSDFQPFAKKNWTQAQDSELIAALQSSSSAIADIAMQQLIWRNTELKSNVPGRPQLDNPTVAHLRRLVSQAEHAQLRLRAIAILQALGRPTDTNFNDPDDRVLHWMVKTAIQQKKVDEQRKVLVELARSDAAAKSPALALSLIAALSTLQDPSIPEVSHLLVLHAGDKWIDSSVSLVAKENVDQVLDHLLSHLNSRTERMVDALIADASSEYRQQLKGRIADGKAPRQAWHYTLGRQFSLEQGDALRLDAASGDKLHSDAMLAIADAKADPNIRTAALAFVLSRTGDSDKDTIAKLIETLLQNDSSEFPVLLARAIVGLGPVSAEQALSRWSRYGGTLHSAIISACLAKEGQTYAILDKTAAGSIDVASFQPAQIEQLRSMRQPEIIARVEKLFGPPPGSDRLAVVEDYLRRLPKKVDVVRGEAIYKQHCAQCHQDRADARGGILASVGPNLQSLSGWKNDAWLSAILDPNRSVEAKYRRMNIRTTDGQTLVGLKIAESDDTIEIINDQGQLISLDKGDVEDTRESEKSLMPEGFERVLPPEDVASVVAYLRKAKM